MGDVILKRIPPVRVVKSLYLVSPVATYYRAYLLIPEARAIKRSSLSQLWVSSITCF